MKVFVLSVFIFMIILVCNEETNAFQLPKLNHFHSNCRKGRIFCNKVDNISNSNPQTARASGNTTILVTTPSIVSTTGFDITTTTTNDQPLNTISNKYFPVKRNEVAKFTALSAMLFLTIFVFSLTRDTKDVLIVMNCGAEAIAFLKVYGVIPAATLFMIWYSMLANRYPLSTLFYIVLTPFFAFFLLFGFVLYPYRNSIHPLHLQVPESGMSYAVQLIKYWSFSLYYIASELWGSASIPLLFWSCANEITDLEQAKRLYPMISMIGNLGPILSGIVMTVVSSMISRHMVKISLVNDEKAFEWSLKILSLVMVVAGGMITALHAFVRSLPSNNNVTSSSNLENGKGTETNASNTISADVSTTSSNDATVKKSKPKLSFFQSLQFLASNDYLKQVAIMVLSYGLSIEFTEILWKAIVKKAFPVKTQYLQFMGKYSTYVGISSCVMMFVGSKIVQSIGWKGGALLSPMIMALFALPFFGLLGLMLWQPEGGLFGLSLAAKLTGIVYIGLVLNVLTKGSKYAVFDPTKEMAYIPLDGESKSKGKAAIDVLGARLGKAGGALLLQGIVVWSGDLFRGVPLVTVLFYLLMGLWISSVYRLAPQVESLSAHRLANNIANDAKNSSQIV